MQGEISEQPTNLAGLKGQGGGQRREVRALQRHDRREAVQDGGSPATARSARGGGGARSISGSGLGEVRGRRRTCEADLSATDMRPTDM